MPELFLSCIEHCWTGDRAATGRRAATTHPSAPWYGDKHFYCVTTQTTDTVIELEYRAIRYIVPIRQRNRRPKLKMQAGIRLLPWLYPNNKITHRNTATRDAPPSRVKKSRSQDREVWIDNPAWRANGTPISRRMKRCQYTSEDTSRCQFRTGRCSPQRGITSGESND